MRQNKMHEGDMAYEIAERELLMCTVAELVEYARKEVHAYWERRAADAPEDIRNIYSRDFMGESR